MKAKSARMGMFLWLVLSLFVGTQAVLATPALAHPPAEPPRDESSVEAITFVETTADDGMPGVSNGFGSWGDYDRDGDLDVLLTGHNGITPIAWVYRNNSGIFQDIGPGDDALAEISQGSAAWGDYDQDGDLDVVLAGFSGSVAVARVYRNDLTTGFFSQVDEADDALIGVSNSSVAWGDYDRDGDLDIVITGSTGGGAMVRIYRNDKGFFNDAGNVDDALIGVSNGTAAWGDYDSDGDLDLLLVGLVGGGVRSARLFRNTAGIFQDSGTADDVLVGLSNSSAAWSDYDNDGDLDLAITGFTGVTRIAKLYRNVSGVYQDSGTADDALVGSEAGGLSWGDYDNDGDPDLLQVGSTGAQRLARLYRNDAGTLVESGITDDALTGIALGNVAWGDYDNDGALDILLCGVSGDGNITRIYKNSGGTANTPPTAPTGLNATVIGSEVAFAWSAASDSQTPPAGLTYNLRVGTSAGQANIVAAMAITETLNNGRRRLPAIGNQGHGLTTTLRLNPGQSYFWSVQAIDSAMAGSPFAAEGSFAIPAIFDESGTADDALVGVENGSVNWGDYDNDSDLDLLLTGNSTTGPYTRLYRNTNGSFAEAGGTGDSFPDLTQSAAAWGDYDSDNDLDLALVGQGPSGRVAALYRNLGGIFLNAGSADDALVPVSDGDVAWGDYDGDADLDLVIVGDTGSGRVARLYRNVSGSFEEAGTEDAALVGVSGTADWIDYDGDGDLDLFVTGSTGLARIAQIFRNVNGTFQDAGAVDDAITAVSESAVDVGDFNSDGTPDLVVAGSTGAARQTVVYRNQGGSFQTIGSNDDALPATDQGVVTWGDHDNDGDLDLLVAGTTGSGPAAGVYRNQGGTFQALGIEDNALIPVSFGAGAWGDADGDGDLDIALIGNQGSQPVAHFYRYSGASTNTKPAMPTGLNETVAGNIAILTWSATTDAQTPPAGLSYNLRVGTTPGGSDVLSPMALMDPGPPNGTRLLPAIGNVGYGLGASVVLERATTYYWSVQAVDSGFQGSAFATEGSFNVEATFADSGNVDDAIIGLFNSAVAWGDYDNDNDLDVVVSGATESGRATRVYKNQGGVFQDIGTADDALVSVDDGSVEWRDFDGDDDLDLLLAGFTGATRVTQVFRNANGVFQDIGALDDALVGVSSGNAAWGDYDADGDPDVVVCGMSSGGRTAQLFINMGGSYQAAGASDDSLVAVNECVVSWGDADNDNDLDLLLAGDTGSGRVTRLYKTVNGTLADSGSADDVFVQVSQATAAWADYDRDGQLDVVIAGHTGSTRLTQLYRNTNGTFGTVGAVDDAFLGVSFGSAAWGDYDNDGDSDLLLSGQGALGGLTKIYRNMAGTFEDSGNADDALLPVTQGMAVWGDYGEDGDLDIMVIGLNESTRVVRLFRNIVATANSAPTVPTGLDVTLNGTTVTFRWTASSDIQTPAAGLTYNLRVGTIPGGSDVVAPMAVKVSGVTNGRRRLPAIGNAGPGVTATLVALPNTIYYWSVQAIDTGFAGSSFGAENSFDTCQSDPDLDNDTRVTVRDIQLVTRSFGGPPADAAQDQDCDGTISVQDVVAITSAWTP